MSQFLYHPYQNQQNIFFFIGQGNYENSKNEKCIKLANGRAVKDTVGNI